MDVAWWLEVIERHAEVGNDLMKGLDERAESGRETLSNHDLYGGSLLPDREPSSLFPLCWGRGDFVG